MTAEQTSIAPAAMRRCRARMRFCSLPTRVVSRSKEALTRSMAACRRRCSRAPMFLVLVAPPSDVSASPRLKQASIPPPSRPAVRSGRARAFLYKCRLAEKPPLGDSIPLEQAQGCCWPRGLNNSSGRVVCWYTRRTRAHVSGSIYQRNLRHAVPSLLGSVSRAFCRLMSGLRRRPRDCTTVAKACSCVRADPSNPASRHPKHPLDVLP